MNAPASNYERFLQRVAGIVANRSKDHVLAEAAGLCSPDYALYRQLKDELVAECHDISPREYTDAVQAISRACGI